MGTRYSNNLPTGYNVSPPSDDGATTAANKISWATIKTKLTDCFNTWAASLNTAILNAFDTSCASITGVYTTLASDNARTLQCSGTFTVSLGDASTLAAGWFCHIVNSGTGVVTVGLATGANTLNGVAGGTMVLPPWASLRCIVNQAANGFNVLFTPSMQGANVVAAGTTNLDTSSGDFVHITGTTAITAITLSKGAQRTVVFEGALTLTNGASLILPGGANITTVAGDIAIFRGEAAGVVRCVTYTKASTFSKQPTRQVFTSGTGATYTTPANATRIVVRMVGPGGGGGAANTNSGGTGTNTTFSTFTASAGVGGTTAGGTGGAGGAASGGTINIPGSAGQGGGASGTALTFMPGGQGGASLFGGSGMGGNGNNAGGDASTNSGSGGGGGGATSGANSGGGGGSGGYVEAVITSPAATYTYTVGTGGNKGAAGGIAGGNGAAGLIIVDEFYI